MKDLNAFDIISLSSGLDLSGLFDNSFNPADDGDRFVSTESPDNLIRKLEEIAKVEGLIVRWSKEFGVELEGQYGNLGISVEIHRLTDNLVVVEARRSGRDGAAFKDAWKKKIKPKLCACEGTSSQQESESHSGSQVAGG
ncbi:hypothetical protein L6164_030731 [Bauhinia variegata]|nr:hypothetical protein L6164_030731 [Bauhinia variegata]